jgi:hypothetical protein
MAKASVCRCVETKYEHRRRRVRGLVTLFGECKPFLYSLSLLILVSGDDLHRTDLCQSNDQPPKKIASPSSPSPSSLKGRSEVINPPRAESEACD